MHTETHWSDNMEEYEEEETKTSSGEALNPKERLEFLKNIFSDEDWYDGTPFFQGGRRLTQPRFSDHL